MIKHNRIKIETIPGYLLKQAEIQAEAPALRDRQDGTWKPITWVEYASQVEQAARALISLGLEHQEKVSILGFNRPEWVIFDVAAMMAGGIPAGIYETSSPEGVAYILYHSESKIVLVENGQQLEKVKSQVEKLPHLKNIVLMKGEVSNDPFVLTWEEFLSKGKEVEPDILQERFDSIQKDQVATLIYTSGTTGPPKAVMLSHRNLTWTAGTAIDIFNITSADSSLSYLPLAHIAEQMFTIHGPIIAGWRVDFAESQEKAAENLRETQPTIFFGVPRVWEKIYDVVTSNLKDVTGMKKEILNWSRKTAEKVHGLKNQGLRTGRFLGLRYGLTQKLIFSKLKSAMGFENLRFSACAAAPIDAEILKFFASLDIPIVEVYGQSEGSGPTSFNQNGRTRYGSVGPPVPGVEVKIETDGEIVFKGPNVFLGYFKDENATSKTIVDGWLYSGDLGRFDDDGYLWITGRKKEIIVTSGGENISPVYIEGLLRDIKIVGQVVVIGDKKKYLTALITLNKEAATVEAREQGLPTENLQKNPAIVSLIQEGINGVNDRISRVENIRKYRILPREFSQDKKELTPTLKLIRHNIYQNWADVIEEMYEEEQ